MIINFKKSLKEFVNITIVIMIFTLSNINSLFADHAIKTTYSTRQALSGDTVFSSSIPGLSPGIYTKGTPLESSACKSNSDKLGCDFGGDLNIQLSSPFCIGYIAVYAIAMYAGDATAKAVATAILLMSVILIFGIAAIKYSDFEICGANWLNWGHDGRTENGSFIEVSALSDFYNYYPKLGAFAGSRKYNVVQCTKNFDKCVKICKEEERCKATYQKEKEENEKTNKEINSDLTTCLDKLAFACMLNLKFMEEDNGRAYLNINDQVFRERFYDGEEVPSNTCLDPREEARNYDVNKGKPASKIYQFYYMKGYDPGNYACDRFLFEKEEEGDKFDEAYKCCVKSSNSVCIKDKMGLETLRAQRVRFCNANQTLCTMDEFIFEIFHSKEGETGKYCAKTWSLCPYNFNLQHGTEEKMAFKKTIKKSRIEIQTDESCTKDCETIKVDKIDITDECYDNAKQQSKSCQGKIKNFYQYNRHCTIVAVWPKMPQDDTAYPPFIDKACINFVGSSHNTNGYTVYRGYEKMFKTYRSFTAPVAECLSETLKNFLFNRAGHTKCVVTSKRPNDRPDMNGKCKNGYVYTEGDGLLEAKGIVAPAVRLLSFIHTLIMLAVTLMITLYGYNILINSGKLERHDLVINMLKVVIVISFSASGWWYDQIFKFTYSFSNTFSTLTSKIGFDDTKDSLGNLVKNDGCFFGNINTILDLDKEPGYAKPKIEENNFYLYPQNRRYVSFFDAIDCKVTKYMGYGITLDAANLIMLLAMSFIWPFNIGIFIAIGTLMLALFAINFAIKAVYIFVASSIAMTVMLYLSPLIIPCILFKKTKGIFDKWLKELISYSLQPMVMFAFASMALTIMDKYTLGEGIFQGVGINKELVCGYSCIHNNTNDIVDYTSSRNATSFSSIATQCKDIGTVVDIKRNSVLCFLDNITSSPWAILQSLGLFVPLLADFGMSDVLMFLRVGFLFFILTKVLETIPGIASNLTGGKSLPGTKAGDPFAAAKKILDLAEGLKRAAKGIGKKMHDSAKKKSDKNKKGGEDEKEDKDDKGGGDKKDEVKSLDVKKQDGDK